MNNEIAEIICSALYCNKTLDGLAIKLGEVKSLIKREEIAIDTDREKINALENIEALL